MAQSPVLGGVSPQAILDLYLSLSDEQRCETLRLIARHTTAEAPILMTSELSPSECERFSDWMFETLAHKFFPVLAHQAVALARENPTAEHDELMGLLFEKSKQCMEEYDSKISELQAYKLKAKRDRKPDPVVVERDQQIRQLRRQNPALWTLGKLAKKFELTVQRVHQIINSCGPASSN